MHARGERAAAGDGAARSEAIEEHLPLVESVARRYAGSGEPMEDLAPTEDRELLARGWRVLDERERHILELRYKDDLSQSEIARRVGLSQAHVSRLIRGALDRMRAELGEYSDSAMAAPGDAQTERQ